MSTKNDPGKFDCYKKLADDEPYFVLRAKDPIAPYLIEIWRDIRADDFEDGLDNFVTAFRCWREQMQRGRRMRLDHEHDKSIEAADCAYEMGKWLEKPL